MQKFRNILDYFKDTEFRSN